MGYERKISQYKSNITSDLRGIFKDSEHIVTRIAMSK